MGEDYIIIIKHLKEGKSLMADKTSPGPMGAADYKRLAEQIGYDNSHKKVDQLHKEGNEIDGTVTQLQLAIAFDDKLREMATIKELEEEERVTKSQRSAFYRTRTLLVFLYFIVVPYCQSPQWCLEYFHERDERHFGTLDCTKASESTNVRFSDFPTLSPMVTVLVDVLCMIGFCVMACYENAWRDQSQGEKRRTAMLVIACSISFIDLVRSVLAMKYPYFANLMRVAVLLSFASRMRQSFLSLIGDFRDSLTILLTIFAYILVFVLTVYYFYRPTMEGLTQFGSIRDTFRNMNVLFTTANYPDVFLPAMNINYWNAYLFMFFMLMGLYFFVNLLMANIFNKYQLRLQAKRTKRRQKRNHYIHAIFSKHYRKPSPDYVVQPEDYLDHMQGKSFLSDVFDFDYNSELHRETARKIL